MIIDHKKLTFLSAAALSIGGFARFLLATGFTNTPKVRLNACFNGKYNRGNFYDESHLDGFILKIGYKNGLLSAQNRTKNTRIDR
jgi:hypothetical protein